MNLTIVRYLAAGAIALVLLALLAVIALSVAHGVELTAPSLGGLLVFVGTLIGLIANLVGTQSIAVRLADVQDKVNGHLQAHMAQQRPTIASPPPEDKG